MKHGLVTTNTHAGKVRVFLNGDDVTDRCISADDREGWVKLQCWDAERHDPKWAKGSPHIDRVGVDVCTHVVTGMVQIRLVGSL